MLLTRVRVLITGNVQGVFYRHYTKQQAEKLGLTGWVRNLTDGRVEAVFEGEEKRVKEMIAWCWQGSPSSKVTNIETVVEEVEGLSNFEIRHD